MRKTIDASISQLPHLSRNRDPENALGESLSESLMEVGRLKSRFAKQSSHKKWQPLQIAVTLE
jgi:hypothetical protein